MGGMHAPRCQRGGLNTWTRWSGGPRLLEDFGRGRWVDYRNRDSRADIPAARRDLVDTRRCIARNVLQATRGCPFACSSYVSTFFGRQLRARPLDDVIAEERPRGRADYAVDDNIGLSRVCPRAVRALGRRGVRSESGLDHNAVHAGADHPGGPSGLSGAIGGLREHLLAQLPRWVSASTRWRSMVSWCSACTMPASRWWAASFGPMAMT